MNRWFVRAAMAGSLLAQCNIVWGQAPVVDLRELHAREVKSIVFSLGSPQDLRVEAVGAESDRQPQHVLVGHGDVEQQGRPAGAVDGATPGFSTSNAGRSCGS